MSDHGQPVPEFPKPNAADGTLKGFRALVSAIPLAGGPVAELLAWFGSPVERRREAWAGVVVDALNELKSRGVDVDALAEDEAFVTLVLNATQAALRTHHDAKREALRNAILNSGMGKAPDETRQQVFVGLVDRFTPLHLRMLRVLNDPRGWCESSGIRTTRVDSVKLLLDVALPQEGGEDLRALVMKELFAQHLTAVSDVSKTIMLGAAWGRHTTVLGREFLAFIEAP